jgi:pimeloyl-ACP methyl ester carboxylesterase
VVRIRLAIWMGAPIALFILAILVGTGVLFSVGHKARDTDYRSAVGAQQPHKIVLPDGVELAYSDSGGSGPVLLCLPAIGHGARDFEDLSWRLAPQYRVLALDFPGQGNSGPDRQPASATRYAALLTEFIDRQKLNSMILLGNSIGGATAIRYASANRQRVKGLVLCDTGGLGQPGLASKLFIDGFVQFFSAGRRGAFWYPWAFRNYYEHVLIMPPAREERDRIIRSAYEIALPAEQAWRSFAKPEENLLAMLPSIQCPVFLAWANQDAVIPLKYAQSSFGLFHNYQLEVFDGGHAAFLEDPDRFENSLRKFLKGLFAMDTQ